MARPLWELLMEDPSDLTCDEWSAVMDDYAKVLARGGADLRPKVIEDLKRRPHGAFQHREALRRLAPGPSGSSVASRSDLTGSHRTYAKG